MGYTGALASRETLAVLGEGIAKAGTNISFGGKVFETTEDLLSDDGISHLVAGYLDGTVKADTLPAALVDLVNKNRDVFTDLTSEMKTETKAFTKIQDDVKAVTAGVSHDTLKLIMPDMFNADGTKKPYLTGVPAAPTTGLGKVILDPKADPIKRTTAITIADSIQSSGVDAPIISSIITNMSDTDLTALSDTPTRNGFVEGLKLGGKVDKAIAGIKNPGSTSMTDKATFLETVFPELGDLDEALSAYASLGGGPNPELDGIMQVIGGILNAPTVGDAAKAVDLLRDVIDVGKVNTGANAFAGWMASLKSFKTTVTEVATAKAAREAAIAAAKKAAEDAAAAVAAAAVPAAEEAKRKADALERKRIIDEEQAAETRRKEAESRQVTADVLTGGVYSAGKAVTKQLKKIKL